MKKENIIKKSNYLIHILLFCPDVKIGYMKKTKAKKEMEMVGGKFKNILKEWEEKLNVYFGERAPKLPESVAKFIVKATPYLMIIGLIFSLPAILLSLGLGAFLTPLSFLNMRYAFHFSFWTVFSLAVLVLRVMAIPGLFKRSKSAWNLMFYASLITALSSLLSLSLGSLIIGSAISWYFLFQIRKYYK